MGKGIPYTAEEKELMREYYQRGGNRVSNREALNVLVGAMEEVSGIKRDRHSVSNSVSKYAQRWALELQGAEERLSDVFANMFEGLSYDDMRCIMHDVGAAVSASIEWTPEERRRIDAIKVARGK